MWSLARAILPIAFVFTAIGTFLWLYSQEDSERSALSLSRRPEEGRSKSARTVLELVPNTESKAQVSKRELTREGSRTQIEVVAWPSNSPVEKARVQFRGNPKIVGTNAEALVSVPLNLEGAIELEATADGYCVTRARFSSGSEGVLRVPLVLTSSVKGAAVDDRGKDVKYVAIGMIEEDEEDLFTFSPLESYPGEFGLIEASWADSLVSDKEGRFEIGGLIPGHGYKLRAKRPAHHAETVTFLSSGPGQTSRIQVNLERHEKPELEPRGSIEGTVYLNGEKVYARVGLDSGREVDTDEEGFYRFERLRVAEYKIVAYPKLWKVDQQWFEGRTEKIEILPSAVVQHDIRLTQATGTITGRAHFIDGKPVHGYVNAQSSKFLIRTIPDTPGLFKLVVPQTDELYAIFCGSGIQQARVENVPIGTNDIELVLPRLVDFIVDAREGDKEIWPDIWARPAGTEPWSRLYPGRRTPNGYSVSCFPGMVDLWVETRWHEPVYLEGLRLSLDEPPQRFEVELKRK